MTPEEFFYHIFSSLPRQGPGCAGATQKAWSYLPALPKNAQVLDVGCGTGAQTWDLAELTSGTITAVDNYQPFLDSITTPGSKAGSRREDPDDGECIDGCPAVRDQGQFDLIWSEGAIYIMGFDEGTSRMETSAAGKADTSWFRMWRGLQQNPPRRAHAVVGKKEGCIPHYRRREEGAGNERRGSDLIAMYRLPEAGWWEHYYVPMLERINGSEKEPMEHDPDLRYKSLRPANMKRRCTGNTSSIMVTRFLLCTMGGWNCQSDYCGGNANRSGCTGSRRQPCLSELTISVSQISHLPISNKHKYASFLINRIIKRIERSGFR